MSELLWNEVEGKDSFPSERVLGRGTEGRANLSLKNSSVVGHMLVLLLL